MATEALVSVICLLLRIAQPFRKEHVLVPHPRDTHEYEWVEMHYCHECKATLTHRFVEWRDENVTTTECLGCGEETELV